jgi:flavorubredoxin
MTHQIEELVPDRLYRLGGTIPADSRISWLPRGRPGREPVNAYLLLEANRALMIDTGPSILGDLIVGQLRELLPDHSEVSVFLTRIEMDCIGNLGLVGGAFPIQTVHAGGGSNPFDFFDDLTSSTIDTRSAELARIKGDGQLQLGDSRVLRVLKTKLRLLATTWAFDEATGTLFTSDSFGHVGLEADDQPVILNESPSMDATSVRDHLVTKFDFLPAADTRDIRAGLEEIFAHHEVLTIAPGHGRVLTGKELVGEQLALVLEAMSMQEGGTA